MALTVAVVGGGIAGLGIAWEAARRGHAVTLLDPAPASGATHAAAGMLAPVSELHYREEGLLALTGESARLYPAFIDALHSAGLFTGYQRNGTLVVGIDAADRQTLADLGRLQRSLGLEVEELGVRAARRAEPLLGPGLTGAFRIPGDHQVDPRALAAALLTAFTGTGTVLNERVSGLAADGDQTVGVVLENGNTLHFDETVVANGLGAASLDGLPVVLPLRPVHGDILRLRVPERLRPLITATVRGIVHGRAVYVVPREDGNVVLGATQREDGNDGVSAGGVHALLRDAQQLVPAVAELELLECISRARPGTPDNAPLLGRVAGHPGLIIATGLFRHGVLLTPITARICADLLDDKPAQPEYDSYLPDRFAGGPR